MLSFIEIKIGKMQHGEIWREGDWAVCFLSIILRWSKNKVQRVMILIGADPRARGFLCISWLPIGYLQLGCYIKMKQVFFCG